MSELIKIAKECGAVSGSAWAPITPGSRSIIYKDEEQLHATVEKVCGPLVEALESTHGCLTECRVISDVQRALDEFRTLMGQDK